jgi:hypothetical protein
MTGEARNANTRVTAARALIASRATLQDSGVARSRRYLALATRILPGRSSTAAGAELTALVSGAAQGAGLRLASVQVQPDTVRLGVFVRVAVRADFSGDVKGLSNLLLSLERGPLMLRVRELSIAQAEPAGDDSRPEVLRSHVVVEALALSSRP